MMMGEESPNPFRLKRCREGDSTVPSGHHDVADCKEREEEGVVLRSQSDEDPLMGDSFSLGYSSPRKRVCTGRMQGGSLPSNDEKEVTEETRDDSATNMDVGDDILNHFNTISFDGSEVTKDCSADDMCPPFPPLQRGGRRIDHLVDDVIRKSRRYDWNQHHMPNDFEFQMPSAVTVGGSPTRDARFMDSINDHQLSIIQQEPSSSSHSDVSNHDMSIDYGVRRFRAQPPTSYHLGSVTHSDWFDCSNNSRDLPSNFLHSETSSFEKVYHSDDDDDYDDMYIDA
jgi:hypothetical protein